MTCISARAPHHQVKQRINCQFAQQIKRFDLHQCQRLNLRESASSLYRRLADNMSCALCYQGKIDFRLSAD